MASLVEELENVLEEEKKIYQSLLELGEEKRQVLIKADVPALELITQKEQTASEKLLAFSNKQIQTLKDIATVLGKTEGKMTVTRLIGYLDSQPQVQTKLIQARDSLIEVATKVQNLNRQNEALIKQAIELAEFDITLFKSLRQAPETANYNRDASTTGTILGSSGFDAKQ